MASMPNTKDCLDSTGYLQGEGIRADAVKVASRWRQIAALAIAADNAAQLISNYRAQRDIAKRLLKISQKQQDHVKNVFWNREKEFLTEFANPEPIEDVEVMGRRYGGRLVATVASGFAQQMRELKCSKARYCESAYAKAMQDLSMARAVAIGNARVLGRNIAFAEYQARNDRNLERRLQAVALGRSLMQQAVSLYSAAGQGLANAGNAIAGQLNSALTAFGYAARDYSNATGYNSTLMAGQREYFSGQYRGNQPYAPQNGADANPMMIQRADFGRPTMDLVDPARLVPDLLPINPSVLQGDTITQWNYGQNERQMNEADVGSRNLARTGTMTFPVSGGPGTVTIDMDRFKLGFVDHLNPGDTGAGNTA